MKRNVVVMFLGILVVSLIVSSKLYTSPEFISEFHEKAGIFGQLQTS